MQIAITTIWTKLHEQAELEKTLRKAGDSTGADEAALRAAELRQAASILTAVAAGPMWPEPKAA